MKKVLFIDRDGTLIAEPKTDFQVDSLEKLSFLPGVFTYLGRIAREMNYELVMVTNQDGLGTASFPEDTFWPAQNKMLEALKGEDIVFQNILIDRSFEKDNSPLRKPRTGMLTHYLSGEYDLGSSYVIGDRLTDLELASNLGAKGILINQSAPNAALNCTTWKEIYTFLQGQYRSARVGRTTKETNIQIELNLDGTGLSYISTGLPFFDHMLEQIARHGSMDLTVQAKGDLEIDEHHTIEDVGLALGSCFKDALGKKVGIERYGFSLPMDDCLAQVSLDFGGRPWIVWEADFKREKVGDTPTEMFFHFFKSFSDTALCNLNIQATGENEHHKIESIFKSFAKALRLAKTKNDSEGVPSTKGVL